MKKSRWIGSMTGLLGVVPMVLGMATPLLAGAIILSSSDAMADRWGGGYEPNDSRGQSHRWGAFPNGDRQMHRLGFRSEDYVYWDQGTGRADFWTEEGSQWYHHRAGYCNVYNWPRMWMYNRHGSQVGYSSTSCYFGARIQRHQGEGRYYVRTNPYCWASWSWSGQQWYCVTGHYNNPSGVWGGRWWSAWGWAEWANTNSYPYAWYRIYGAYPPAVSADQYEPDNSWRQARDRNRQAHGGADEAHTFHHTGDDDYIKLHVPNPGRVEIWTRGPNNNRHCTTDTTLKLYQYNGDHLHTANDNAGWRCEHIAFDQPHRGDGFARVHSHHHRHVGKYRFHYRYTESPRWHSRPSMTFNNENMQVEIRSGHMSTTAYGYVYFYRGGSSRQSGKTFHCDNTSGYHGYKYFGRSDRISMDKQFGSSFAYYNQKVCVRSSQSNGLSFGGMVSPKARPARMTSHTIEPNNANASLRMRFSFDYPTTGQVRVFRGGNTASTNGGTTCRNNKYPVRSGSGSYLSYYQGSRSRNWDHTASNLQRGDKYCVLVISDRYGPGYNPARYFSWMTPVIGYASVESATLTVSNSRTPQLKGYVRLSNASRVRLTLYEGGSRSGNNCRGGTKIDGPHDYPSRSTKTAYWTNSRSWKKLARAENYCMQVQTLDGGNKTGAATRRVPDGMRSLNGTINQVSAQFQLRSDYGSNYAGTRAYMSFYRDNDCRSNRLKRFAINWNARSFAQTFYHVNTTGIIRGYKYCGEVKLGKERRINRFGTLSKPTFNSVRAIVDQTRAQIRVQAEWDYNSRSTVLFYRGGVARNGICDNHGGREADRSFGESRSLDWSTQVSRGFNYCVRVYLRDGGDGNRVYATHSMMVERILRMPSIRNFEVTGIAAGGAIHAFARMADTERWETKLYRGGVNGNSCSGTQVSVVDSSMAGYHVDRADVMMSRVRRRTQHCVQVVAHNGVLSTSRAASVSGLPTTASGVGYSAAMTNERVWDEITDLNPGKIRNQDDATASVSLGFDFIYFGRYQSRIAISTNGWFSFGDNNVDSDPVPAAWGAAGDRPHLVAPFFANLYCDGVYWKRLSAAPERFVITWDCRERGRDHHSVDVQAVLYRGLNRIEFRYGSQHRAGRDAHFAQYAGGGRVKQGISSGNQSVALSNNLLPAAGGQDGKVLFRNPAYEEYLPRISGTTVDLDQANASIFVRFNSSSEAFLRAKLFRGGRGDSCSGGFYLRNLATEQKRSSFAETFNNLVRGHAYCVRVEAENTAGVAVQSRVTPVLQLVPQIRAYDTRLTIRTTAGPDTTWEAEELPSSGAGTCGPSGDGITICSAGGGPQGTFSVPAAGTYILKAKLGAQQFGPNQVEAGFYLDGQKVGLSKRVVGNGWGETQWYYVNVPVEAGDHTFHVRLMNDYCAPGGCAEGDRNMLVDKLGVFGPFAVEGSRAKVRWSVTPNTDVNATMTLRHGERVLLVDGPHDATVEGITRSHGPQGLNAGLTFTVKIDLTNLAGSASTGWQVRRFAYAHSERTASISRANNTAMVEFSTTPAAFGTVQYKTAGRYGNEGCDGDGWSAVTTGNQAMDNHRATIPNLVDGMYYCWRAVAEYPRGVPWGSKVIGAYQTFVYDKTAPVVTAPPLAILEQESLDGTVVTRENLGLARVVDLVDKDMGGVASAEVVGRGFIPFDGGLTLQLGTHHVRWRATDRAGNEGVSALQRVDVKDTTDPRFESGTPLVVEAQTPQGSQITPKTLNSQAASGTQFLGADICDAELSVTQTTRQDGEGDWMPAADAVYQRSSNPGGVGNHTVRVLLRDDSGNNQLGTYEVSVVDTTAPTFSTTRPMVVGDDESECVTSYVPHPRIEDNSYFPHELTLTNDKGLDFCWATSDDQGTRIPGPGGRVEGSIIVHDLTWTACDPAENCRDVVQRVEVRRPTLGAEATVTVGGRSVEMGTYVNGTVTVRARMTRFSDGCNEVVRSVWLPDPDEVRDGANGEFVGLFTSDGDYLGTNVQLWHCDEFALVPNLTFGKDTVVPEHDFEALDQARVVAENVDSWPRQFVGNKLSLGGMTVSDDRSGVKFIRMILNPGQGGEEGSEWGRETVLMQQTLAGSGRLIRGPSEVTNFSCRQGSPVCVGVNGVPHLDLTKLREFDHDNVRQHLLRIEILDFAGNRTIDDRYFLLRDYKRALADVEARVETALLDADEEDYESHLEAAKEHLAVAAAYWETITGEGTGPDFALKQIQWGPSFRRAERAVVSLSRARQNDAPAVFRVLETDISQAMIGQMQLHLDAQHVLLNPVEGADPNEDDMPDWWDGTLEQAREKLAEARAQVHGRSQAARAADAYNVAAPLYELRYDHLQRVTERTIAADESEDPIEDGELRDLVYALNNIIHSVIKAEISAAREVNNAGGDQLDVVIGRLNAVQGCMDRLVRDSLNDRTFTLCYLDVVEIVHQLRQVQGALVETYPWRSLLGASVFGMLDISIYHSANALVSFEGAMDDPEVREALNQYSEGTAELRRGEVDIALNRYLENRCRMVQLYNQYYADPEDISLGPIEEGPYCGVVR